MPNALQGHKGSEIVSEMLMHVHDVMEADVEALMRIKPDAVIHRDRIRDAQSGLIR
jgi:hypothetical protein